MPDEWLRKTFTQEYADQIQETAYVTANVFAEAVLDGPEFHLLDEVWRYGGPGAGNGLSRTACLTESGSPEFRPVLLL